MLSVCAPEDGVNLATSFGIKFRLGFGGVDENGFDSVGACTSPAFLSPFSGPACDVSGEGWSAEEYRDFTLFFAGTEKKTQK